MGISVLSPVPPAPVLYSTVPNDVVTTAAVIGASAQASPGDHVHKYTHPDTGWLTPTMLNGWVIYDATFGNAAMYRKIGKTVYIRGLIKNGTVGAVCFNLPVGYRPAIRLLYGVESTGAHARLDIDPNGDVIPSGANGYHQITVSFTADG